MLLKRHHKFYDEVFETRFDARLGRLVIGVEHVERHRQQLEAEKDRLSREGKILLPWVFDPQQNDFIAPVVEHAQSVSQRADVVHEVGNDDDHTAPLDLESEICERVAQFCVIPPAWTSPAYRSCV